VADELNPHTFRWEQLREGEEDIHDGRLWAGLASYPARFYRESAGDHIPKTDPFWASQPEFRMESRQAWVHFENMWHLSVIWGDATYSSNSWSLSLRYEKLPFIEEPTMVEVGVLPPVDNHLWGEPMGYVDVPMFVRLAELVMHLPTDIELPEGDWESAEGFCDFLVAAGLERTFND